MRCTFYQSNEPGIRSELSEEINLRSDRKLNIAYDSVGWKVIRDIIVFKTEWVLVPSTKERGKLVQCLYIQERRLIVCLEVKTMSLRAFAYEEVVHEPCCKTGKLRVKKRFRLHAIEEFAAQQLVVLPILTSPTPLSPANSHQTFCVVCSLMQCCFLESVSLVLLLVCFPLFVSFCCCCCCYFI